MLFSLLVLVVSLALIYGGVKLVALGGSSYYLIAGLAYLLLAVLFFAQAHRHQSFSGHFPGNVRLGIL